MSLLSWCGRRVYNHLYDIMPHAVEPSLARVAIREALEEHRLEVLRDRSLPDNHIRKSRPSEWTRSNAAGEVFHTYHDPDVCPDLARMDEQLWLWEQSGYGGVGSLIY